MKRIAILLAITSLHFSCETESFVVKNGTLNNLSENTSLMHKLKRLSQFPTTADNIVDGTSCFALKLPVAVVANDVPITLNTVADYQQVRAIFAQHENDTDHVLLQFPVTVTCWDYHEEILQDMAAFEAAAVDCNPSVELSCIDFLYPIQVKSYDSRRQLAQTFSLGSNPALFQFLDGPQTYDSVSLVFPVGFVNSNGNTIAIAGSEALEAAIDNDTETCLAALDPGPTNPGTGTIAETLAQGTWHVSYFFRESNQTSDYTAYDFTFNSDGSSSVTGESWPISGTWAAFEDDGEQHLNFTFSSSNLEELEESWTVTEHTPTLIKMEYESGGSGTRYFNVTRN